MKKTNCPNCGAPIEHYYNYKCPYCNTFLHNTDEEIKKLNNVDIKFDNLEIERSPMSVSFILTIRGWSVPKFQYYEETDTDYGVVISGNDIGKRVGYRIEIPYEKIYELRQGNIGEFIRYIDCCLPPVFDYSRERIISETIEKLRERNLIRV